MLGPGTCWKQKGKDYIQQEKNGRKGTAILIPEWQRPQEGKGMTLTGVSWPNQPQTARSPGPCVPCPG